MNSRIRPFALATRLVILGTIGSALFAQQSSQPAQPASRSITASSTYVQGFRGVVGFPYSADQVTVTTQTLADGTKITHERLVKLYRDGEGRTRHEFFPRGVQTTGQDGSPESVSISDPVAGAIFSLNPREHTAEKREMHRPTPAPLPQTTGAAANSEPVRSEHTREDLGTQVIEGLEARGERITRTIPAGAEGNDQPLQITQEIWTSTKPRLMLLLITNDPRYGESVARLTNLVLDEPPAELFQVPGDYTVKELQPVARPELPSD